MYNPFALFKALLPDAPLAVGEVVAFANGVATVELPGGQTVQARGSATVGQQVFIRDGRIDSVAPTLTGVSVTV